MRSIIKALRGATIAAVVGVTALLQGCGGDGSNPNKLDLKQSAASVPVTSQWGPVVVQDYDTPGTYKVTVRATYTATSVGAGGDQVAVWLSASGQGTISGADQSTYAVSTNGQVVTVSQALTMDATGLGPWQMRVIASTAAGTGTLTNVTIESVMQ